MKEWLIEQIDSTKAFLDDAIERKNKEDEAYARGQINAFELVLDNIRD